MRIARCPRGSQGASCYNSGLEACPYEVTSLEGVWTSVGGWESRAFAAAYGVENRGVRVRMTRISLFDALGTPNPVRRRDGVTMWQVRRISNCVQSCASTRRRSCASTSRQNSVIIDGVDSGAICGQCSWDVPNNAISARAGPFMCRMRADEESTIMPESEEGRREDCLISAPETAF